MASKIEKIFESMNETSEILSDKLLMPKLLDSISQAESGEFISLEQLKNNLGLV